jgi:SAM-dependent methyltransferase
MLGWLWEKRAQRFASLHLPFLKLGERILDVGAGNCRVARLLDSRGLSTTPVDISDYNATHLPLRLYDGKKLPFPDGSFDVVMLAAGWPWARQPAPFRLEAGGWWRWGTQGRLYPVRGADYDKIAGCAGRAGANLR